MSMAWLEKRTGKNIKIVWKDSQDRVHRHSTGTKDENKAKELLAQFKEEVAIIAADPTAIRFSVAADSYIKRITKENNLKQGTVAAYRTRMKKILQGMGDFLLCDLDDDMIQQFKEEALDVISHITLYQTLSFLNSVLAGNNSSIKVKNIKKSVAENAMKEVRAFTDRELEILFSDKKLSDIEKECFLTLLHTGMRADEACQLVWEDLVKMNGSGKAQWFLYVRHEPGVDRTTKTKKSRYIPLSRDIEKQLFSMKERDEKENSPHIFYKPNGNRQTRNNLAVVLKKTLRSNNIDSEQLVVHSFRHTFIQRCLASRIDFRTIMAWSGHRDLKSFMVYLRKYQPVHDAIHEVSFFTPGQI